MSFILTQRAELAVKKEDFDSATARIDARLSMHGELASSKPVMMREHSLFCKLLKGNSEGVTGRSTVESHCARIMLKLVFLPSATLVLCGVRKHLISGSTALGIAIPSVILRTYMALLTRAVPACKMRGAKEPIPRNISLFAATRLVVSSSICRKCETLTALQSHCSVNARNAARNGPLLARFVPSP